MAGEPFPVLVRAIDSWGTRSDGYIDSVTFGASDLRAVLPEGYTFKAEDKGAKRLQGVILKTVGLHNITVKDGSGREATSGTIIVREEKLEFSLFWGDFHGQTKETVATGSLDEYFSFARDVGGVDFAALQGNDFQVTRELWNRVTEKVKEYHEPGKFVTFLGYEWSGLTPAGGDHNVYFLGDEGELHRSNHLAHRRQDRGALGPLPRHQALGDLQGAPGRHLGSPHRGAQRQPRLPRPRAGPPYRGP